MTDRDRMVEPTTIDEARLQMVAELHRALYGDVWARPDPPEYVWHQMLDGIERVAAAVRSIA